MKDFPLKRLYLLRIFFFVVRFQCSFFSLTNEENQKMFYFLIFLSHLNFTNFLCSRCSPRIVQCSPFPDSASLIAYGPFSVLFFLFQFVLKEFAKNIRSGGETYIAVMVRQRGKPSPEEPTTSNKYICHSNTRPVMII
jgi:hypothetical protein